MREQVVLDIARMIARTLAFVMIAMTVTLLGGLFLPNNVIDNKDIFPIIAPAFSTIVGGFIGWLAAIKINGMEEETPNATE
ncbi:hypothetical protein UFOVP128_25 [uncultured Caudovirales phage]|uniref:Uncharacterized protein n=1 Tax=uncultured Caudovirales phage TaxID=2100421 RepID=A0A6J7WWB7_9CAUD|nr:hypothetical protein UFOVP128_25 [uncultured Caudovirales phage]CAB5222050.1 hypothetical protein UFOVP243_19 [uncultured Caudovirales phage]